MQQQNVNPIGIALESLIRFLASTKLAYSHRSSLRMNFIASRVYDEFYTHIKDYEEFIELFKVQFKDIFTEEEMEELDL